MKKTYDSRIDRRADQALKRLAAAEIEVAKALVPLHESRSFTRDGSGSIGQYAEKRGVDRQQVYRVWRLGQAMVAKPELEQKVRDNEVPSANASAVGRVLSDPKLLNEGDDWVGVAEQGTKAEVQDAVQARIEKKRQPKPRTYSLGFHVSKEALEAYRKLMKLLSRKRRSAQTPGQVFAFAMDSGLELIDADRKAPRKRRAGPTSNKPSSRYVPAEVRRKLRERSGNTCEYPGCDNDLFLEKSHGLPKRKGGGQELEDLAELCNCHHGQRDAGEFLQVGWTMKGEPIFQRKDGEVLWPRGAVR